MSCVTLKELIDRATGELGTTRAFFATHILGIHRDTLRNWERDEGVTRSPRAASSFNKFIAFMESPRGKFLEADKNMSASDRYDNLSKEPSSESFDRIREHYHAWKLEYDSNYSDSEYHSLGTRVKSSTMLTVVTQWNDKRLPEKRTIRINNAEGNTVLEKQDIPVLDEYICYRHDALSPVSNMNQGEAKLRWDSYGKIEILEDGITEFSEEIEPRRLSLDSDRDNAHLILKVDPARPHLNYFVRIINDLQRKDKDLSMKTLDGLPTEMMQLSVNYALVYGTGLGMQLDERPKGYYIFRDYYKEIEVHKGNMTWTTLYKDPEPDSLLRLQWW